MTGAPAIRTPGPAPWSHVALVAALAAVPLLPFLDTALSLDAPVFVAVARQILADPLDPFGFEMAWDMTSLDAAVFNRNPPLLSYYLAAGMAVFGESEWLLHSLGVPVSVVAALAFYGIARRLLPAPDGPESGSGSRDPLVATALLVTCPAFLVLGVSVLLDVPVLACTLVAVYGLLRSAGSERGFHAGWAVAGGLAAAAAGLVKYVGFSTAPLLAAGVALLCRRRSASALALVGVPLVVWALWGAFTAQVYGEAHFWGARDVVGSKLFDPRHVANKLASIPVWYGAALLFPILQLPSALAAGRRGRWLVGAGLAVGVWAVGWALPEGRPPRRIELQWDEAALAMLAIAGTAVVWGQALRPRRQPGPAGATELFLVLWLGGLLVFTAVVNWHVNAADALLAAPPLLLLWFRSPFRPSPRAAAVSAAACLAFSLALAFADARQSAHYRDAAERIAAEIGARGGERWFVGQWGLYYYLEAEGFRPIVSPALGGSTLAVGDWVVSARNVSQLDVRVVMNRYRLERVWSWPLEPVLPLRATNGDAGAGFYSHHYGYTPFAWSDAPAELVVLGRVVSIRARAASTDAR